MKYLNLVILVCLGVFVFSCKQVKRKKNIVIDCHVYDENMQLENTYAGNKCVFLSNGHRLFWQVIDHNAWIVKVDERENIIWKKKFYPRHFLQITPDEKNIFISVDDIQNYKGKPTRFDTIVKLDVESGEQRAIWRLYENMDFMLASFPWIYKQSMLPKQKINDKDNLLNYDYEYLHFNSLNIIPKNKRENELDYLKQGNLIVTPGQGMVLIFDQNLKLIHNILIDNFAGVNYHDFQITEEGDLLVYQNYVRPGLCPQDPNALVRLKIMDIKNFRDKWKFSGSPQTGPICGHYLGSVQILDDQKIFFTDLADGGRVNVIDKNGNLIKRFFNAEFDPHTHKPSDIFKAKIKDLNAFMDARRKAGT